MSRRLRIRRLLGVAVVSGLLAGCAIREDGSPRDIPEQERNLAVAATGDEAVGLSRIYLLAPTDNEEPRLRAVARDVADSPDALLDSLISGLNEDELDAQLSTAVPGDLEVLSARSVGFVLTIDVNDALSTLTGESLPLALAQIVATTTELDDVERVRIRTSGENQAWPTGDGRLTTEPLSIYDYPGRLETSQPAFPTLPST